MGIYAAYGSNLDYDRMQLRAPHSPASSSGWLTDWRLTFAGHDTTWDSAIATVVEAVDEQVFVMLYDLSEFDERQLDQWESAADIRSFRKVHVRVSTLDGDVTAWLYVVDDYEGGLPSVAYLAMIADAAEAGGAPDDYVADVRGRTCRAPNDLR